MGIEDSIKDAANQAAGKAHELKEAAGDKVDQAKASATDATDDSTGARGSLEEQEEKLDDVN